MEPNATEGILIDLRGYQPKKHKKSKSSRKPDEKIPQEHAMDILVEEMKKGHKPRLWGAGFYPEGYGFVVADEKTLYDWMSSLDKYERTLHETIIQDETRQIFSACHLYIDFEFDTELNQLESLPLLNRALDRISEFGAALGIPFDTANVRTLDSSRTGKASYHCTWPTSDGRRFKTNADIGAFMRRFALWCIDVQHEEDFKVLKYEDHTDPETKEVTQTLVEDFVIDLGVYTRYRQFRLVGNHKAVKHGKKFTNFRDLKTGECERYDLFQQMLISDPYYDGPVIVIEDLGGCIAKFSNAKFRTLKQEDNAITRNATHGLVVTTHAKASSVAVKTTKSRFPSLTALEMDEKLPSLNKVLNYLLEKYGGDIHLATASVHSAYAEFRGSKTHCETKGGVHKSNRNYFCFNLATGRLRQKCLDPLCREQHPDQTTWPLVSLPPSMVELVQREFWDAADDVLLKERFCFP